MSSKRWSTIKKSEEPYQISSTEVLSTRATEPNSTTGFKRAVQSLRCAKGGRLYGDRSLIAHEESKWIKGGHEASKPPPFPENCAKRNTPSASTTHMNPTKSSSTTIILFTRLAITSSCISRPASQATQCITPIQGVRSLA